MAEQKIQNFQNHVRNDPKIIVTALIYVAAIILAIAGLFTEGVALLGAAVVLMGIGALLLGVTARTYSTTLQDRIIMLEMRLRLERILDAELGKRIPELTRRQLVSLRFESDANLPALVKRVFDENVQTGKEIKQQVKDWQADWHRV